MATLGIQGTYKGTFDDAVGALTKALAAEGFGVLTEVDIAATFQKKLGVSRKPYKILGACNPGFASQVLGANPDMGMFLPCNVAVYEADDGGIAIRAIDPMQTIAAQAEGSVGEVAREVQARLTRAVRAVANA
jgi:uncharacterized protein (DUF302 family)